MTSTLFSTGRRRVAAGLLAALVLAVAVVGVRTVAGRRRADPAADPGLSAAVSAVIPQLEAFVEQARGLKFLSPVKVSVLGDAAFRRRYDAGGTTDAGGPDPGTDLFRALGLDDGSSQNSSGSTSDADSVDGYYDSDTKELVVRGTSPTPFVRQVLVHELTHALDDQHFGLDPDVVDDEAGMADDALVEGDATAIEYRYVDSLSPAEQRQAADEENAAGGTGFDASDPLAELDDFPYVDGPDFIAALVAAGGQARVDDAFRAPPTTSAEILHPDRYLSGRGRAEVRAPVAGGRVADDGVIGEYLLGLVLEETVPKAESERAAAGWAGDHYVAWRSGRRTCVRVSVALDTDNDRTELASAVQKWAADHRGATVDASSSTVDFSRCG
ncbi:MAG TPA: hypothetical protein VHT97_08355 [Acidimicrobiales bacterium]|nr:hypothetical protein [Acidimicrobiales bacterium]